MVVKVTNDEDEMRVTITYTDDLINAVRISCINCFTSLLQ